MRSIGYGKSDIGRERERNEDVCLADDGLGVYGVCDGMGGHAAGDTAAALAVEAVVGVFRAEEDVLRASAEGAGDVNEVRALTERAIQRASEVVYERATADRSLSGMGCTLTVLVAAGPRAVVGHVGDTRLYMVRGGAVHRLTQDHTLAVELMLAGHITADKVREHPFSSTLTRAVGSQDSVQVDTLVVDVLPGDRFLLCSDGLTRYVDEDGWIAGEMEVADLGQIPDRLLKFANQAGGEDNISAVVVEFAAEPPERPRLEEQRTAMQRRQEAVDKVFLFEALSLSRASRLLEACEELEFDDGQVIADEGSRNTSMWMVVEGQVAIVEDGAEIGRLGPGMHAGSDTLLHARPARATLVSRGRSRLLRLDREEFRALARTRPWLGVSLMDRLGRRVCRENDELRARVAAASAGRESPEPGRRF